MINFTAHSKIAKQLGFSPTQAWNKGDMFTRKGKNFFRKNSSWIYTPHHGFREIDENLQLGRLIKLLMKYRDKIQGLPAKTIKRLTVVHETSSCNADKLIDRKAVEFAASIGAEIRLDMYSLPSEPI